MDERTLVFLGFIVFSLACFAGGYAARRCGWVAEAVSRPLHLHTIIWLWSPVTLLAFWGLELGGEPADGGGGAAAEVGLLMVAQPVLMAAAAGVMWLLAAAIGCKGRQRGVLLLAAGLSNHGFTLGAYLCYAILEPGDVALRYGIAYVTSMQLCMVPMFYPIAHHYGDEESDSLGRLILGSFVTLRAMPLYTAMVGLGLNLAGVEYAKVIDDSGVLDALFFLGAAGAYGGIGMRFRFGDTLGAWREHGLLAVVQFVAHPLLALGLVAMVGWSALPVGTLASEVILVQALMPTALNTVMLSNLFHLDARLASVLWLWNTLLFCVVVLPGLLLWWGTGLGG